MPATCFGRMANVRTRGETQTRRGQGAASSRWIGPSKTSNRSADRAAKLTRGQVLYPKLRRFKRCGGNSGAWPRYFLKQICGRSCPSEWAACGSLSLVISILLPKGSALCLEQTYGALKISRQHNIIASDKFIHPKIISAPIVPHQSSITSILYIFRIRCNWKSL